MTKQANICRSNDKTDRVISPPGESHPWLGDGLPTIAAGFAPDPEDVQKMLVELRRHHRWSQVFTATVLGVSVSALRKWESGARHARGCAAKLIFLLHSQLIQTGKVQNCWDLAVWGSIPCRTDFHELAELALKLNGTHFVPDKEVSAVAEMVAAQGVAYFWAAKPT